MQLLQNKILIHQKFYIVSTLHPKQILQIKPPEVLLAYRTFRPYLQKHDPWDGFLVCPRRPNLIFELNHKLTLTYLVLNPLHHQLDDKMHKELDTEF